MLALFRVRSDNNEFPHVARAQAVTRDRERDPRE